VLVSHPKIPAIGFTGSHKVGNMIMKIANERPVPIPVYAEMGSVNPLFILPDALRTNSQSIADGLATSFTLGCGQFCTNPGLVFVVGSASEFTTFLDQLRGAITKIPAAPMLTQGILETFRAGVKEFQHVPGIKLEHSNLSSENTSGAVVFSSDMSSFKVQAKRYQQELFGPSTLLIRCASIHDIADIHEILDGQLTATFHGTQKDLDVGAITNLISSVSNRVGRVLWGGFPTGVEVNHSMHHGGPYPACSDARFTSVGARSILRWVRPLCFQGFPEEFLPPELLLANPNNITRMVDGKLVPSKDA